MTHQWDEFSKSLAEPVPRRESLRRLGVVLAAAVLSPLGTAWAAPKRRALKGKDPCQTFCQCRNKAQQNACLAACRACSGGTRRLCGACGSYACTDLAQDFNNCGACGRACPQPGPYEYGACVAGGCTSACVDGAVRCNGVCTMLDRDPYNCGACGNVCPDSAPVCINGACTECLPPYTFCFGVCINTAVDVHNCGACGFACAGGDVCEDGMCWGGGGYSSSEY